MAERRERIDDEAMVLLYERIRRLRRVEVEPHKLIVEQTLTKEIEDYVVAHVQPSPLASSEILM